MKIARSPPAAAPPPRALVARPTRPSRDPSLPSPPAGSAGRSSKISSRPIAPARSSRRSCSSRPPRSGCSARSSSARSSIGSTRARGRSTWPAVALLVAALVEALLFAVGLVLISYLGQPILATLRERVVARALKLPAEQVERGGRGDLLSRLGDDIAVVSEAVVEAFPPLAAASLTLLLTFAGLATIDRAAHARGAARGAGPDLGGALVREARRAGLCAGARDQRRARAGDPRRRRRREDDPRARARQDGAAAGRGAVAVQRRRGDPHASASRRTSPRA